MIKCLFWSIKIHWSLDKNQAKLPVNPKEVSQVASAENNYWKLATELDIRMSSVEKGFLQVSSITWTRYIETLMENNVMFSSQQILLKNYNKTSLKSIPKKLHIRTFRSYWWFFFFESWIVKNPKNDKANELGFDVPWNFGCYQWKLIMIQFGMIL
jgi:hypothetical protein